MKILMLSPWLPHPPTWGFVKRVYHTLEVLTRRHQVTLCCYDHGSAPEDLEALRRMCAYVEALPAPAPPGGKRLAQALSVLSTRSFQRRLLHTAAMQSAIDRLSARDAFDIVHVQSSQLAGFRFDARATVVLDEHNIEYELYHRMARGEGSLPRRAFNWLEYLKFRREEIASWRASDGCVMTSAREAVIVNGIAPSVATAVVPNAVDTEYFAPSAATVDRDAIVFTGLMKYRPNVDGVQFFVRDVLPLVRRARPNARFYIVGAEAPPEVTALASPHVIVTGSVDDVRPYVATAAVVVVPLRMGSGTRLKVLEGLAMARPMVTTSLGCEGIELVDGEHAVIADAPDRFAAAVVGLMDDAEGAARLAAQARALVLARYRWETAVETLDAFYTSLRARRAAAGPTL